MGQKVEFIKNEGPVLGTFNLENFLDSDQISFTKNLQSIYTAIEITRKNLDKKKSLIAFIGAPWTLLVYMLGLKKNKNEINLGKTILEQPKIKKILDKLSEFLCLHIKNQVSAGADVVQIFDSWAGLIPLKNLPDYCYTPNLKIVEFCKKIKVPVICFPKGIRENYKKFNNIVMPDGINLDYEIDPNWSKQNLKNVVLQGGLDPKILFLSDEEIKKCATKYLNIFKDIPYVFNLGHGLLPETDPEKVDKLIKFYREYK